MKSKVIKAVTSSLATILAWVSLAFVFGVEVIAENSKKELQGFSLSQWFDMINEGISETQIWEIARIFMFISLSLATLAAVVTVLKIFIDNKTTKTLANVFGISALVVTILFLITFLSGGFLYATSVNTRAIKHLYFLNVGAALTGVSAIISSCFAISWVNKHNNKNK